MKFVLYLVVLTYYTASSDSSIYSIIDDLLSSLKRNYESKKPRLVIETNNDNEALKTTNLFNKVMKLKAKSKKEYEVKTQSKKEHAAREHTKHPFLLRGYEDRLDDTKNIDKEHYQLDPILNFIGRRNDFRRKINKDSDDSNDDSWSSSSMEMENWKDQFKEHWMKKKLEAINSTEPKDDAFNMVAARPWGVPCGDPNQHDMPWGTCMLPTECDSEYRIYRGDYFCGRTQFICCAVQLTNYDMYQGFDVSFADSGLSTDSEEKRNNRKGSKEKRRREKRREKKRRKQEKLRRKRKIKKNIKKIVREIRKLLNKAYRNGTIMRKKKTKELKMFIQDLKKRYKTDRQSVKDIHEEKLIKIDAALQKKLDQISEVNQNFMTNRTFRDIIVNGTTDKKGARMLVEAYPDLMPYLADKTRRTGDNDHNDYDIEYGLLY